MQSSWIDLRIFSNKFFFAIFWVVFFFSFTLPGLLLLNAKSNQWYFDSFGICYSCLPIQLILFFFFNLLLFIIALAHVSPLITHIHYNAIKKTWNGAKKQCNPFKTVNPYSTYNGHCYLIFQSTQFKRYVFVCIAHSVQTKSRSNVFKFKEKTAYDDGTKMVKEKYLFQNDSYQVPNF